MTIATRTSNLENGLYVVEFNLQSGEEEYQIGSYIEGLRNMKNCHLLERVVEKKHMLMLFSIDSNIPNISREQFNYLKEEKVPIHRIYDILKDNSPITQGGLEWIIAQYGQETREKLNEIKQLLKDNLIGDSRIGYTFLTRRKLYCRYRVTDQSIRSEIENTVVKLLGSMTEIEHIPVIESLKDPVKLDNGLKELIPKENDSNGV